MHRNKRVLLVIIVASSLAVISPLTIGWSYGKELVDQSTHINQGNIYNAARDIKVIESPNRSKIIDKIAEIARKCREPNPNTTDIKTDLDALVLYRHEALPHIISFMAMSADNPVSNEDPESLVKYRKAFTKNPLVVNSLFYAVRQILTSDTKSWDSLYGLYLANHVSKESLVVAYYLWTLDPRKTKVIFDKLLQTVPDENWDPVRRVLLRAFLSSQNAKPYVLKPNVSKPTKSGKKHKVTKAAAFENTLEIVGLDSLGLQNMKNGHAFLSHMSEHAYRSLGEETQDEKVIWFSQDYPKIKSLLGDNTKGTYLFGFDMWYMRLKNLKLENVLLGKSSFEKAEMINFAFLESTLLECDFSDARLTDSLIEDTNFVSCNLGGFSVGGRLGDTIFKGTKFYRPKLTNTEFYDNVIINTTFEQCVFEIPTSTKPDEPQTERKNPPGLILGGTLMLNTKFDSCDASKISFDNVFVDEPTLRNISSLPEYDKLTCTVDKLDLGKVFVETIRSTVLREGLERSPEGLLRFSLQLLSDNNKSYVKVIEALRGKDLFLMSCSKK